MAIEKQRAPEPIEQQAKLLLDGAMVRVVPSWNAVMPMMFGSGMAWGTCG